MSKHPACSYRFYSVIIVLLSLSGLGVTLYLSWSHYRSYTDITYSSFCAISQTINCDTVAQSPWSIFLNLPVAIWGGVGYSLFILFLIPSFKHSLTRKPVWNFLALLSFIFSVISIYFAYISATKIHSFCILCICSYIINFLLFVFSLAIIRLYPKDSLFSKLLSTTNHFKRNTYAKLATISVVIIFAITYFSFPHYWEFTPTPLPKNIATGITEDGHPWIGSKKPTTIIDEYTDYQCFQCYKMSNSLRRLISEPRGQHIRLIHHHYPMDSKINGIVVPKPFHEGSGDLAKIAILATFRDKFWETDSLLYEIIRQGTKEIPLKYIADSAGLDINELTASLTNTNISESLRRDIWQGMKLGITGTPSFVIDGKVYQGSIPAEVLEAILK